MAPHPRKSPIFCSELAGTVDAPVAARNPLDEEGLNMDIAELVALVVALSVPLWLAVEEIVQRVAA